MLFNSIDFAVFLPIVFIIYWFITQRNLRTQNVFIVVASYFFYGWWDWRFLFLIFASTVLDYTLGIAMSRYSNKRHRMLLLWASIGVNIGFLGFFKYYNFFIDNFSSAFSIFGMKFETYTLQIILPVGISFYTFQTLSYTIDVYRNKLKPTKDFPAFASFVCFFPQLVAGPIERATHLLPQFYKKRKFVYSDATDGMRQILLGLFKKLVIADNCAKYVNIIFENYESYSGSTLVLGAVLFSFQIYGDFSGYSDIAIGTSRLFGFDLRKNFHYPYFSRDIAEFWRRWHISLSTWFRDYVYIPLGGSRVGSIKKIRNVFIIFIISGFWHGANWTFIIWGALNALFFLPLLLTKRNRTNLEIVAKGKWLPSFKEISQIGLTYVLTTLAWVFFRADSLSIAVGYLRGILNKSILSLPEIRPRYLLVLILLFVLVEWTGRERTHPFMRLEEIKWRPFRWIFYIAMVGVIFYYKGEQQEFIYFQF